MAETAEDLGEEPGAHATLEELAADPERVADAAAARPVRIDRPGGAALVLVTAEEFDRLRLLEPKAMHVSALTDEEMAAMLAQPIPPELTRLNDEIPEGWFDRS